MIDRLMGDSLALLWLLFLHIEVVKGKCSQYVKKIKTFNACDGAENQCRAQNTGGWGRRKEKKRTLNKSLL